MRKTTATGLIGGVMGFAAVAASLPYPAFATGQGSAAARPGSIAMRQVADWVIASGDNQGLPFVIVDKVAARTFVFYPDGRLRGATPTLLGAARGDESAPGIGERKLSAILPRERTTPAGRFVSSLGNDLGEKDVVWVDYAAAISLHRVVTNRPKERRLQRLATATVLDNRISYGCINVPARFYDAVVRPAFTGTDGIVYILPEVRPLREVFPAYQPDVVRRTAGAATR